MGEGLMSAKAAALRTQIGEGHMTFLRRLLEIETVLKMPAIRNLLPPADRGQDRIRQKCCKLGLARWRSPAWELTDLGRAVARNAA